MRLLPLQAGTQVAGERRGRARQLPACPVPIPSRGDVWEEPSSIPLLPVHLPPPFLLDLKKAEKIAGAPTSPAWPLTTPSPAKLSPEFLFERIVKLQKMASRELP